jgi:hypothetical protein
MCVNAVLKADLPIGQCGIVHGEDRVRVSKPLPNAKEGAWDEVISQNHLQITQKGDAQQSVIVRRGPDTSESRKTSGANVPLAKRSTIANDVKNSATSTVITRTCFGLKCARLHGKIFLAARKGRGVWPKVRTVL